MVRPAADRIAKWNANLDGDSLSVKVGRYKEHMLSLVTQRFGELVNMEDSVKAILDEEGVSTTQYPFYLGFGRQVYRLKRKFGGGSLINATNIWLQRWVADGYTQAILERIRDTVFALGAPPGP
jgi:hypothetical protein